MTLVGSLGDHRNEGRDSLEFPSKLADLKHKRKNKTEKEMSVQNN